MVDALTRMARPNPIERPEFAEGMRLHNAGEHYEAHEAWEELWRDEEDDRVRLFLQGLIQVTSAFHKLFFQKEPVGAGRLLARGLDKLAPYPDDYAGVALGPFREGARACASVIARLEPTREAAAGFDRSTVPPLRFLGVAKSTP
jgi:predicted metal-dependent hydrolase